MTEQVKKPSGVLFKTREKIKDTTPDHVGNVELDPDMVRALVAKVKENIEADNADAYVKLNLNVWENIAKTGMPYMSVKGYIPKDDDDIKF